MKKLTLFAALTSILTTVSVCVAQQSASDVDIRNLSLEERQRILQQQERQNQQQSLERSGSPDANNPYNKILIPLTGFGHRTWQGEKGGLYPGGSNTPPEAHLKDGIEIANGIRPLDRDGNIDEENGRVVWLSVGMSNTTQSTRQFIIDMQSFEKKNPKLKLVDGAFGGQDIKKIGTPDSPYWQQIADNRLHPDGLSTRQVQVVWFKEADSQASDTSFTTYPRSLMQKYGRTMLILKQKFPNLKIVYLSPRTYAGYAKTRLNPEPFAWYTGWAIKYLIEEQVSGRRPPLNYKGDAATAPWLTWGPYLWANGEQPNAEGIFWLESDFGPDGTHPSPAGQKKVAQALIRFFSTDPTAIPWFTDREK